MNIHERCYLRISTTGRMEIRTFDPRKEDINDVIREQLNGAFYEIVRCRSLPHKFLMLVDDCGFLEGLEYNDVASALYGVKMHGCPIVGTAVIMREDYVDGEPDIFGLTYEDVNELVEAMRGIIVIKEVKE